jgi:signal transduction histidine kinase
VLEYTPAHTLLTITDDGNGFEPATSPSSPGPHFGIHGMCERAAKIGARLTLESAPGAGCVVTILLPNLATP